MNLIRINDINDPNLELFNQLKEPQLKHYYEPEVGIFIAESPNVVERAMNDGYEPLAFLLDERDVEGSAKKVLDMALAQKPDIEVFVSYEEVLKNITGFKLVRGVLCAMRRRVLPTPEEVVKNARRIVVLEDVNNATNLGAIIRSAAALNMDAVLLTKGCVDPLYRRATRVSMGTVFQIPWTYMEDSDSYMTHLKGMGFTTVAMALRKDTLEIQNDRLKQEEKLAIIMGTEGDGLKDATLDQCDYTVKIPMGHGVDSLNVAAASAIAFFELSK